jgi:hypothetical protein
MKLVHRIGLACISFGLFVLIIDLTEFPLGGLLVGLGCSLLIFYGNNK